MSGGPGPVLVVGGSGFVGSHLVERLAAAGGPVRILSRRGWWPWGALPHNVTISAFDLIGPDAARGLPVLLRDVSAIVNLAGALLRPGVPAEAYERLHVASTARILEAARAAGPVHGRPLRLVHVSTTGVLGPTGDRARGEEDPPHPTTVYESTKLRGERLALEAAGPELEVVAVRPGLVYGERDLHLVGLFRAIASGAFRLIAGGTARWQPIHVEDVARGIATALETPGVSGEVFHLAGAETVTVADLAGRIAATLGGEIRRPDLPYPAALLAGALLEAAFLPFGIDPPLSRGRVRTLTQDRLYRIDRARERLGFTPRVGLDEGIARAVEWYRTRGHL